MTSLHSLCSFSREAFQNVLDAIGSDPFVYLSNPGNYGDSLIREGTLQLFHDTSRVFFPLQHREAHIVHDIEAAQQHTGYRTLVYAGSGAWIHPYFSRTARALSAASRIFERVIVLPSTYLSHTELDLFVSQHRNIIFFRRDDFISKQAIPYSILAPDMALYIHYIFIEPQQSEKTGFFFRHDRESRPNRVIPATNFDLSLSGNETTDVSLFFQTINQYEEIHTDRLHIGIAGFLLGKKVIYMIIRTTKIRVCTRLSFGT